MNETMSVQVNDWENLLHQNKKKTVKNSFIDFPF